MLTPTPSVSAVATKPLTFSDPQTAIHSLPPEELRDLSHQCYEMIKTVCARLGTDDEMEAAVRRLMRSEDLLAEFAAVERENPATALRVLNAALATLVNSHSMLAIEVEFERRARERN